MLRSLLLAALAALLLSAPAVAQVGGGSSSQANCTNGGAGHFEIGLVYDGPGSASIDITVTDTRPGGGVLTYTVDETTEVGTTGCAWIAYVAEGDPTDPQPEFARLLGNVRYTLRFDITNEDPVFLRTEEFSYLLCTAPPRTQFGEPPPPVGSVYCPYGEATSFPDLLFYYSPDDDIFRVVPLSIITSGGNGGSVDDALGQDWVLPLNHRDVCESTGTCVDGFPTSNTRYRDTPFLTRQLAPPYTVTRLQTESFPLNHEAVSISNPNFWSGHRLDFDATEVSSLSFAPGQQLRTDDAGAYIDGVTLTADDAVQGWGGVSVEAGVRTGGQAPGTFFGNLTLGPGTLVTGTNTPHGAVRAEGGATVTLDGAVVDGNASGPGVVASGSSPGPGTVRLLGNSRVRNNAAGAGVLAENGGFAAILGDQVEIHDNARGVEARTGGARVLMTAGTIRDNIGGPGVRAGAGGTVDLWSGYGGGGGGTSDAGASTANSILVHDNIGGLYAEANTSGFGNSGSGGGTITTASNTVCVKEPCPVTVTGQSDFQNNRGNPTDTRFDMVAQVGSLVDATENYWGTTDPAEVEFPASDAARISYLPILTAPPSVGGGTTSQSKSGDGTDFSGVALAVATADRLRLGNGPEEAGAALLAAHRAATTDDDRALVAAGAARLLRDTPDGLLRTWAQAASRLPGTDRPWARRALAEALLARDRTGAAAAMAQSLADQDGAGWAENPTAASHRIAGLVLVLRTAIRDLDRPAAGRALGALAEVDAAEAAVLAVMAAAALGEIDTAPKRGPALPTADATLATASLDVWPNPTAGALTVRVLDATGAVEVAVFDALGRQVATLHDGDATTTLVLPFDGAALAPGVYVVRVRTESGVSARSFTIAR